MIKINKYKDLGSHKIDWLDAHYHFSFANYYDPAKMGFGKLRVINDDIIAGHGGFDTHPHKDMEIITYVRSGKITHEDSKGNLGQTAAGDVQVMSAGSGIYHSEFNADKEAINLYQIWILPHTKGVAPRWDQKEFPKEICKDELKLLVSGRKEDEGKGALFINQYASISGGTIAAGTNLTYNIKDQVYLLVSKGEIELDGKVLKKGDGAEITKQKSIAISAKTEAEVLVIDVPE